MAEPTMDDIERAQAAWASAQQPPPVAQTDDQQGNAYSRFMQQPVPERQVQQDNAYSKFMPPPPAPDASEYGWMMSNPDVPLDFARVAGHSATFGLDDRLRGLYSQLTGGKGYSAATDEAAAATAAAQQRLGPGGEFAAAATGAMLPGVALPKLGVTLFREGLPLASRVWRGIAEGAGYGAAQGAGQTYSGNPEDYAVSAGKGAGMGAVLGGVAPVVGQTLGSGYRWLANKGWGKDAVPQVIADAANADISGLRNLPPGGMLPDAGPSMQGVAQGAVTGTGGEGRTALVTALENRDAGAGQRIQGTVDALYGPAPVPSRLEAGVRQQMANMGPAYDAVLNQAKAVDTEPAANWLQTQITNERGQAQSALKQVRGMLDIPDNPGVLDPHPRALQATRSTVGGMLDDQGYDPNTKRVLKNAYDMLSNELQTKVPGIRELDSQYAELGAQQRALQPDSPGATIFGSGRQSVIRPAELAQTMQEAAQPKGVNVGPSAEPFRLQDAARAELDRIVGTSGNDLNALERTLGKPEDWNAQKLGVMFGKDKADALMNVINRERTFRDTYQNIVQGSQTAQRTAAKEALDTGGANVPTNLTLTGIAANMGKNALSIFQQDASNATRDRIARWMATQNPAEQQAIIDRLLNASAARDRRQSIVQNLVQRGIIGGGAAYAPSLFNR
jgi:hypothetical protein